MSWIDTIRFPWFCAATLAVLAVSITPDAFAEFTAVNTSNKICYLYEVINGRITKAFAIFAIIMMGISAFFGKINWGQALLVCVTIVCAYSGIILATMLTGHTTHAGSCYATVISGTPNNDGGSNASDIRECANMSVRPGSCATQTPCPASGIVGVGDPCIVCDLLNGGQCAREP